MSRKKLDRVTCTLPADLVRAADAIAAREGRSRSWVVTEALRKLVAEDARTASKPMRVSEAVANPYAAEFEEARRLRREADLALTPEQRIQAVEDLAQFARSAHPQPRFARLAAFDTWEDYFAWKKQDVLL